MINYGMFTEEGNRVIGGIVSFAKDYNYSWKCVLDVLAKISEVEGYEEAMDTVVRESVYEALFRDSNQPFYI